MSVLKRTSSELHRSCVESCEMDYFDSFLEPLTKTRNVRSELSNIFSSIELYAIKLIIKMNMVINLLKSV